MQITEKELSDLLVDCLDYQKETGQGAQTLSMSEAIHITVKNANEKGYIKKDIMEYFNKRHIKEVE